MSTQEGGDSLLPNPWPKILVARSRNPALILSSQLVDSPKIPYALNYLGRNPLLLQKPKHNNTFRQWFTIGFSKHKFNSSIFLNSLSAVIIKKTGATMDDDTGFHLAKTSPPKGRLGKQLIYTAQSGAASVRNEPLQHPRSS